MAGEHTRRLARGAGPRSRPATAFAPTSRPASAARAFCRLEHVVPWAIRAPHWERRDDLAEPPEVDASRARCSHCDAELGEVHVLLVRHRGEHRIADGFCSVDHLSDWAKAGGRWQWRCAARRRVPAACLAASTLELSAADARPTFARRVLAGLVARLGGELLDQRRGLLGLLDVGRVPGARDLAPRAPGTAE